MADDNLKSQVAAIINAARTVIAAKGKDLPFVDATTYNVTTAIIKEAQAQQPNDKILAAVKIEGHTSWTAILAAMDVVDKSLPDKIRAAL